jgi:hypothetical protein
LAGSAVGRRERGEGVSIVAAVALPVTDITIRIPPRLKSHNIQVFTHNFKKLLNYNNKSY